MREYTVFLSSGETICGTMNETEYQRLCSLFLQGDEGRHVFSDTQGQFVVAMNQVIAVGGNRVTEEKTVGF